MKTCVRFSLLAIVLLWAACRPTTAQPVQNGFMAVTCYSDGNPSNPVVGLIDVTLAHLQTVNQHWPAPATHGPGSSPWNRANLGEVFGIAFNPNGDFYVSATSVYGNGTPGGPGGSGAIYRINGGTGAISIFTSTLAAPSGSVVGTSTIPNMGSGLGNIAWDVAHNQMFATNFEDGKIYRISSAGVILSVFDPFSADAGTSSAPAPLGERLWGIGVYNNRVYFSLWNEDCGSPSNVSANEIWSVGLNGVGDFSGAASLEISVPTLPSSIHSNPVSDIAFSANGEMLLAERTMINSNTLQPNAHASRVLEYGAPAWTSTGDVFSIGLPGVTSGCGSYSPVGASCAGGVDYAYATYNSSTKMPEECDEAIWASGDALKFAVNDFIYGFQRLPASGGSAATSVLIDADGNLTGSDKTNIGDVEVYKRCEEEFHCDDIEVTLDPVSLGDGCCYELTVSGVPAGMFTSISANMLTAGVTFTGVIGPAGWTVTNTGTTATWDLGGTIPSGTTNGLQFCVSTTVSPPQMIEVVLHATDGTVCRYTFELDCEPPPPGPCVVVNDDEIECVKQGPNGWVYEFSFTVTNYSPFSQSPFNLPAENLLVYGTGMTITPSLTPLVPSLGYGATSGTLNYTLTGPGLQPGDTVCIEIQLHGAAIGDGFRWCCPPEMFYFILPPCRDCCDSVDIAISNNAVKQIGNTAASVSSGSVTVTPGPIMKVQASIMNVSRSRVWCPNANGVYVPVSNPTTIGALITGATINPAMPLSAGITPPTSEVIWGTVYSGVNFSGGSVNLNLSFPNTNLGWRCQDTLTVCVRYSFTDTNCITCDTVVYYKIPRCGRIEIADPADPVDIGPITLDQVVQGQGISVGEPLYSDVVEGPELSLTLSGQTAGRLAVGHWWNDAVVGIDKIRLVRMKIIPEPGIEITRLTPAAGGEGATVVDRTATIAMDLHENEIDYFDITFTNPNGANFFALRVSFDYVDTDEPGVELASREYIVYGDLNGGGSIAVLEESKSNPVLYKLLIGSNANHSADWISPACFRFTPPEGMRILASGPMPDSTFAEFHVLKSMSREASVLMQLPTPGDYRKEYIAQDKTVELWLVLEGKVNVFDLDWEAMNMDGEIIGVGNVELSPTSTVDDGDDVVPGATIHLLEAYPNPTDGAVTTRFNLARSERVSVAVFDLAGNEVTRLIDNERMNAGSYEYELNLKSLPSGAYYIRLTTDAGTQTRSVVRK